jgi:hypothetical protein
MEPRVALGALDANAVAGAGAGVKPTKKTIEQTYQKKTQLEHILLRPDSYGTLHGPCLAGLLSWLALLPLPSGWLGGWRHRRRGCGSTCSCPPPHPR